MCPQKPLQIEKFEHIDKWTKTDNVQYEYEKDIAFVDIPKTVEEHIRLLDDVFSLLQQNKLYLKEKKCSLFLEKINFLEHVISADGVSLESGKVEVVQKWPVPQNVTHVQQFLGLCNYYRRCILRFSEVAGPLTMLTRKNVDFVWG